MWKKIALGLVAAIVLFLIFVATRPSSFRVERSITVEAPPSILFEILTDFKKGQDWSPWEKMDPQMKKTFSGPESGVGATYAWEGNDEVGKGEQKIVHAAPDKIVTDLHFIAPFEAHNKAEYLLSKEGAGTKVTWAIYGPSPFMSKLAGVFMDMDALIGKDFETGLSSLKALAEKEAKAAPAAQ